jgi:hypothetical protein
MSICFVDILFLVKINYKNSNIYTIRHYIRYVIDQGFPTFFVTRNTLDLKKFRGTRFKKIPSEVVCFIIFLNQLEVVCF